MTCLINTALDFRILELTALFESTSPDCLKKLIIHSEDLLMKIKFSNPTKTHPE